MNAVTKRKRIELFEAHRQAVEREEAATASMPEPLEILGLLDWTRKYRSLLGPERPLDLGPARRYLQDIYSDTSQRIVVMKSAQTGLSEWMLSAALHAADMRNMTVMYLLPTDQAISDYSVSRWGPAFEASTYLSSILRAAGKERGSDRISLKRVRDSFIHLKGARLDTKGSSIKLRSTAADLICFDEYDEHDPRAYALATKRLNASVYAEEKIISTPTFSGFGIHKLYTGESDCRTYQIQCAGCRKWQPITLDNLVIEFDEDSQKPLRWHGQDDDQPFFACTKCQQRIDMTGHAEWVAEFPGRSTRGYHVSKFHSPICDLSAILRNLQSNDASVVYQTYTQDLGVPHSAGNTGLDSEDLTDCERAYTVPSMPGKGKKCFAGVDVGKVLHVVIREEADPESGERRLLWVGTCSFTELVPLLRRYNVYTTVCDLMPEVTKVREVQKSMEQLTFWPALFSSTLENEKDPVAFDYHERRVDVDRTRIMDHVIAGFLDEDLTLPANGQSVPDYYDQLRAPKRVIQETPRCRVARYIETGPDHFFLAEVYCFIAHRQRVRGAVAGVLSYPR